MSFTCQLGDRPESAQALYPGVDSCSYPKIAVEDPSSPSSSASSADEALVSTGAKKRKSPQKDRGRRLNSRASRGSSFSPSPQPPEGEPTGVLPEALLGRSPPLSRDRLGEGPKARAEDSDSRAAAVEDSTGDSMTHSPSSHPTEGSWGTLGQQTFELNGQHREDLLSREGAQSSVAPEPEAPNHSKAQTQEPPDTETQSPGASGLKRTRVGSGEVDSQSSPSEKKLKT